VKELRRRQCYDKPSVTNRIAKMHAVYVQKMQQTAE
jgi:small subunit ribosomal protein S21